MKKIIREFVIYIMIQVIMISTLLMPNVLASSEADTEVVSGKYIKSLYGATTNSYDNSVLELERGNAYSALRMDLSSSCGWRWHAVLGCKYTSDYSEAIRGIIVVEQKVDGGKFKEKVESIINKDGIEYTIVPGAINWQAMNGLGSGDTTKVDQYLLYTNQRTSLFIYTTKDVRAGSPIGAIGASDSSSKPGWNPVCGLGDSIVNVNPSGSSRYLYYKEGELPDGYGSTFGNGSKTMVMVGAAVLVVAALTVAVIMIRKKKALVNTCE